MSNSLVGYIDLAHFSMVHEIDSWCALLRTTPHNPSRIVSPSYCLNVLHLNAFGLFSFFFFFFSFLTVFLLVRSVCAISIHTEITVFIVVWAQSCLIRNKMLTNSNAVHIFMQTKNYFCFKIDADLINNRNL